MKLVGPLHVAASCPRVFSGSMTHKLKILFVSGIIGKSSISVVWLVPEGCSC